MSTRFRAFADAHPEGDSATRPLVRLGAWRKATRPGTAQAFLDAANCRFQA